MKGSFYISNGVFSDEDECQTGSHDCDVNAQCNNTSGSFKCISLQGYFGDGMQGSGMVWWIITAQLLTLLKDSPSLFKILFETFRI